MVVWYHSVIKDLLGIPYSFTLLIQLHSQSSCSVSTLINDQRFASSRSQSNRDPFLRNENAMAYQPCVSPDRGRKFDICERSPTSQATCKICRDIILQGATRIGIQQYMEGVGRWRPNYYHKDCLTENTLRQLYLEEPPFPRSSGGAHPDQSGEGKVRAALQKQDDKEEARRKLVFDYRGDLREKLRLLRKKLADEKGYSEQLNLIFTNKTLDDIVAKAPTTQRELLAVNGFGPNKCREYGPRILAIIKERYS
eukprot:scaffold11046_cov183-Amphora_coffeaeformis.AAC.13